MAWLAHPLRLLLGGPVAPPATSTLDPHNSEDPVAMGTPSANPPVLDPALLAECVVYMGLSNGEIDGTAPRRPLAPKDGRDGKTNGDKVDGADLLLEKQLRAEVLGLEPLPPYEKIGKHVTAKDVRNGVLACIASAKHCPVHLGQWGIQEASIPNASYLPPPPWLIDAVVDQVCKPDWEVETFENGAIVRYVLTPRRPLTHQ